MADKCVDILKDLPSDLEHEIRNLEDAARSPHAQERLAEIKERIKKSGTEKLSQLKIRKYNTILKAANALDFTKQFGDRSHGLTAFLVGVYAKAKGAGASLDADMKARTSLYQQRLTGMLRAKDLFEYFQDKNNRSDIARALFKLEDARDDKAKHTAQIIKKIYKEQIDMLNARGAKIDELEDFISSQSHDRQKMMQTSNDWRERSQILRAAFKQHGFRSIDKVKKTLQDIAYKRWSRFIKPLLDDDRTFGPDSLAGDREDILRKIYLNLLQGKRLDEEQIFAGKSGVAVGAKRRVLHFKDSDSFVNYNSEFGHGTVNQSILNTIDSNSKNIAILDKVGTDPDTWYELVKNQIISDSDDPGIRTQLTENDKFFKTVLNRDQIPVNHLWANISTAVRNALGMAQLGGVVLRSLPDIVQELSALRSNGVGLLDRYKTVLGQTSILMAKERMKFLMDSFGVMNVMGHFNNRFMANDDQLGAMTKMMSIYYKVNLQEYWDKSMRLGFAQAIGRHLANLRDKSWNSLPDDVQRTFNRYGMDETDWDLIRNNREALKNYKGKMYVTPDMAQDIDDESISNYLDKDNLTDRDRQNVKDGLQFKLQQYFLEETDTAQLTPAAADRAMLLRGHQRGTVAGELLRFISQYKQYSLNITRRGLGRLLLQDSNDRLMQSMLKGNVSTRGLLEYMVNAAIMGYVSTAASGFVTNGYIPNPSKASTWGQSLINGGGLGMFGDYLFHNYNQYGQGLVSLAGGPALGAADDMAKFMSTLATFDNQHHRLSYHDRVLKNAIMLSKRYTPFGNLFMAKAGFHYMLNHHVMNYVDQGYLSQHTAAVAKQNQDNLQVF